MQDFDGPLSLILLLLKKNKIEIRDLSVAMILDQYLAFLQKMQEMDLEIASEFVEMASQLIYMKAGMMLKSEEEISELEVLMQSLEILQAKERFQSLMAVLPDLQKASAEGFLFFPKSPEPVSVSDASEIYQNRPADLLEAFLRLWQKESAADQRVEDRFYAALPHRIVYSTREKGTEVVSLLRKNPLKLKELYDRCRSESEFVATFLAVLELCTAGSIRVDFDDGTIVLSISDKYSDTNLVFGSIESE